MFALVRPIRRWAPPRGKSHQGQGQEGSQKFAVKYCGPRWAARCVIADRGSLSPYK